MFYVLILVYIHVCLTRHALFSNRLIRQNTIDNEVTSFIQWKSLSISYPMCNQYSYNNCSSHFIWTYHHVPKINSGPIVRPTLFSYVYHIMYSYFMSIMTDKRIVLHLLWLHNNLCIIMIILMNLCSSNHSYSYWAYIYIS